MDVIARYWLPVDADATRRDAITGAPLAVVSSTAEEKAAIATLIAQVREWLVGTLGWPEPVQVDSGNGYCDYYALPGLSIPRCPDPANPGCLKYDAAADTLIRDVIHALGHKFTSELGSVDDAVFNPSRVMKIPGTFARKAKSTPERPHRASQILHIPQTIVPVSLEQLRTVAGQYQASAGAGGARGRGRSGSRGAGPSANGQATHTSPLPYTGPVEPATPAERARRIKRAQHYFAKVPVAISGTYNQNGQKGHDATLAGLGKVIRRLALTREMAIEALADWNSRCEPPWSAAELAHKLDSIYADAVGADDWGKLLDGDTNTATATESQSADTATPDTRPKIPVDNNLHGCRDAILDIIQADPALYKRGWVLTKFTQLETDEAKLKGGVTLRNAKGTYALAPIDEASFACHLAAMAYFYKEKVVSGKLREVQCDPPATPLRAVLNNKAFAGVRPIQGVVECPYLLPDGALCRPGYNPEAETIYIPTVQIDPLPAHPTKADALAAKDRIYEYIRCEPTTDR